MKNFFTTEKILTCQLIFKIDWEKKAIESLQIQGFNNNQINEVINFYKLIK